VTFITLIIIEQEWVAEKIFLPGKAGRPHCGEREK